MKATKKIVGAACALVAAVALSAGSTFAWFSANNKVTATGMKVQVVAPTDLNIEKGLVYDIADINEPTIDFSLTEGATQKAINPVRIEADDETTITKLTLKVVDEWKTKPTSGTKGEPSTYKDISEDAGASDITHTTTAPSQTDIKASYVYMQPMSLANKGAKAIDLNVEVKLSGVGTEDYSYKFLKCGFLINSGDATTAKLSWVYMNSTTDFTDNAWTKDNLVNLENNKAYTVTFVVWFDGDDTDCIVNNALNPGDINIDITYTAATESAGAGD